MNTKDPHSWDDLANHPVFAGGTFDPQWYDGDAKEDILRLRSVALRIVDDFPGYSCELIVLDDCTTYISLENDGSFFASVYPALTDDYKPCYFVDFHAHEAEFRVGTVNDVVDLLRQHGP